MKILKKTIAVLLCACALFAMASCSSQEKVYRDAGAKWAIDAYKALPAEFNEDTCNQFWAGGDVLEFPMKTKEFSDKGWEIIDAYQEDVDWNYLLDPYKAYELGLRKDGASILTWIYNGSDEALPASECTVIYVKIGFNQDVLLPGGALLTARYKTLDEALGAFNKEMTVFDEENCIYGYWFDDEVWGNNCSVRIDFSKQPDSYKVAAIEYYAIPPEDLVD